MALENTQAGSIFGRSSRFLLGTLVLLLAAGFGIRLLDVTDQPLDFHPSRQLRDAIIARGMYYQILPSADPQQRETALAIWKEQAVYEPPILERLVAFTYLLIGGEKVWVARIFTSLFWCIGGYFLFILARRITSADGGIIALAYYLFLPFGVLASRSFQPDPVVVMWILIAVYALYRWAETDQWKWAVWAGIFSGVAILFKTTAVFLIIGVFGALVCFDKGIKALKRGQTWLVGGLLVLIPAIYYMLSIGQRSGGFFEYWTVSFINLLKQPWFYLRWLAMLDTVVDLSIFFISLVGVLLLPRRGRFLAIGLWIGYAIYGMTLPYQIYTHNYYSLPLIPVVAFSLVGVAGVILNRLAAQTKIWRVMFISIASLTLVYYGWSIRTELYAHDYRNAPKGWVEIGAALPDDGATIALTQDYGHRLEYYGWTHVTLWPYQGDFRLESLRGNEETLDFGDYFAQKTAGYHYFLVTMLGELDEQPELKAWLSDHYPVYKDEKSWIIYDLSLPK